MLTFPAASSDGGVCGREAMCAGDGPSLTASHDVSEKLAGLSATTGREGSDSSTSSSSSSAACRCKGRERECVCVCEEKSKGTKEDAHLVVAVVFLCVRL